MAILFYWVVLVGVWWMSLGLLICWGPGTSWVEAKSVSPSRACQVPSVWEALHKEHCYLISLVHIPPSGQFLMATCLEKPFHRFMTKVPYPRLSIWQWLSCGSQGLVEVSHLHVPDDRGMALICDGSFQSKLHPKHLQFIKTWDLVNAQWMYNATCWLLYLFELLIKSI